MMKQYRYASGWAYSVISLQEKKALSIEISAKRVSGRVVEGDTYVHTNRYLHKDMLDAYAHINRAVDADAEARLARAGAMLESFRGAYVPAAAMAIVGDKYDLVNERLRAVGNTVAVHDTLTSVVVDGARGRVFMANGLAPVSLNTFVELPLPDRADPATFAASAYETVRNDSFKSQSPKLAASEQLFIHGKVAYEKRNDPHEARRLMDEAHALVADPHYRFVSGLLSLKLGDFDAARRAFVEVRGSWDEHLRYLGFYYGARVLAHEGRKAEALVELKALALALPAIETKLKDAVRKAVAKLERPLGGSLKINSSRLVVLIHQGDTVSYD
jgi:tetratricopeptide (TPR) repeat protein